jgi:hypothetical protein
MIQKFVDQFKARESELRAIFAKEHPGDYEAIVKAVVSVVGDQDDYHRPDPERIHCIDDGDYQGTLVFVIGATGYQPSDYWFVKVSYGSCSGCDTLQAISDYSSESPNEEQIKDYLSLALHIVQGLKVLGDND